MRRAWATLQLALFGFSLIGPALFAPDSDLKVPACCRRDGKHRCASMAAGSSLGPAIQGSKCSLFPSLGVIAANQTLALAGVPPVSFERFVSHRIFGPSTESLCHSSYSRAGQKRGPPILLS